MQQWYLIHWVPTLKLKNCGFTCSLGTTGFITLFPAGLAVATLSLDKMKESVGSRQEEGTECSRRTSGDLWTSGTGNRKHTQYEELPPN